MRPVLFSIGSLNINTYGLMLGLGITFGLLIMWFLCKRFKVPEKTYYFYFIIMVISTVIGLFGAWAFQQIYRAVEASVNNTQFEVGTDLTFMGGLVLGVTFFVVLTVICAPQNAKKDFWKVSSYCAPGVIMALAIGRMGCFFAGCCWGITTNTGWDVMFNFVTRGGTIGTRTALPVNLFEAIFSFILAIIMILMIVRFNKEKYTLFVLGGGYAIWRFAIEFARGDPRAQAFALSPSQIQSIILLAVTIALMVLMIVFRKVPFANRVP
ncbi:MAG: prolipoprotein diacylglyceryl transferase, partial [Firmicutes bacterium]|nr:prolipoprotein diacylglyceryl transferase [Bacillota bacterium]